jgi:hypothetical protein
VAPAILSVVVVDERPIRLSGRRRAFWRGVDEEVDGGPGAPTAGSVRRGL